MSYTTRFNPSANGGLHLGHAYTTLVNEAVAHESGGQFYVRFEDTARSSEHLLPFEQQWLISQQQKTDLEWLEIPVDRWIWQSELDATVTQLLRDRFHHDPLPDEPWRFAQVIGDTFPPFPLAPTLTARKVVMDWMAGVNCVIRGIDLTTEYGLYQYFCRLWSLPEPAHIFLPRLRDAGGDVSKTNHSTTLAELRATGWTPGQVRDKLTRACLKNCLQPWTLVNLQAEPRL
jgi:glutamyl/glutaminyl-tRNA synthetase